MSRRVGSGMGVDVGPNTPLRLDVAAEVGFPAGGMTASGLRQEEGGDA